MGPPGCGQRRQAERVARGADAEVHGLLRAEERREYISGRRRWRDRFRGRRRDADDLETAVLRLVASTNVLADGVLAARPRRPEAGAPGFIDYDGGGCAANVVRGRKTRAAPQRNSRVWKVSGHDALQEP